MSYSLLLAPDYGDIRRNYNGHPIDYYGVADLPQWEGNYDRVEFLLFEMLGDSSWEYEDEVYSPDYATNFASVRMTAKDGELPVIQLHTPDFRTVSVVLEGLYFPPIGNVSDLLDYLYHVRVQVQSQVDYLTQMAVSGGYEIVRTLHHRGY